MIKTWLVIGPCAIVLGVVLFRSESQGRYRRRAQTLH
ncbi:hypothetical protein DVUA0017 (plasmid) [Nitratidesulfovibrio vulgaris str. Hildenborough]|uniref:Uncharacterized protein n=1 Tax=Nitratidesulfovibrio vulgaris (strain ATCC 29579 / DSM 644 / CCUG 34227 / NCIMB 8303 / VKM B-1760 / Hildenborough) TaxID=882 RepID=Q72WS2_NITV2|nr:hypothetical protein DVUA0017 [Nitratidesulfovibrio vulgaris str. Hildenborough]